MPARLSSMEISSPDAAVPPSAPRRKSGRVVKKPKVFAASSPAGSAKRKRTEETEEDVPMGDDTSEEELEDDEEGEPDEEELREKKRAKRGKKAVKKSAPKKAKTDGNTNGEIVSLAIRPAGGGKAKKPRKARAVKSSAAEDAEGLYAEIFASDHTLNDVAAQWISDFTKHESRAVADIVNFVLKCAGCDSKVDTHDIEDPDSCATKLTDIQEEYQAQNITDYPLISRAKGTAAFKQSLIGFFRALIESIAKSGLLFNNIELIENIEVWVSTMSSASNRPFRHTATVVSLAIISALCDVGKGLVENTASTLRQSETEAKKPRVNKARVASLEKKAKESGQRQEVLESFITDWFDTVFVHRYRDVDPKIRVDCVEALSEWIMTYPDHFFDSTHLRYLGWVLSDTHAPTRLEVVKQLQKLFRDKDKLGGLKTFTERFRARIVEMATSDAEATVRAASVELLDILREAGLLEPDDIDSVGRLIFDSEPRVRKAVVGFFAENINGTYESQVEEMGGQEALDEALVTVEGDDDYDNPRLEWLKLKCLVEQLAAYDSEEGELPGRIERVHGSHLVLIAAGIESRFALAAQALYDYIPEIRQWEVLAGYLLYDHSQAIQNGSTDDAEALLKESCRPTAREEIILLEILNAAVKLRLTHASDASNDKKKPKTKAQRQELQHTQEETARHLAVLIPRLLKKFGALPDAASSVLNLERVLNLGVFQELRQDATLAALLDDINKQFLTHGNERVLLEASEALRHAQSYDELKEATEGRVQALWDDTINAFNTLAQGRDFSTRGSLSANILTGVTNTVLRIANLATISDCTDMLETPPSSSAPSRTNPKSKSKKSNPATASSASPDPPITSLIALISRGIPLSPTTSLDPTTDALEDTLTLHALRAIPFYFMWKVSHWSNYLRAGAAIPDDDIEVVAERRDRCVEKLTAVLRSRKGADEVRVAAAGGLLQMFYLFASLRTARGKGKAAGEWDNGDWEVLLQEITPPLQTLILQVLNAAEVSYAKRAGKTLEPNDNIDDDPVDPDDEPLSDSDDENEVDLDNEGDSENETAREEKMRRALVAEQRLCELGARIVLALAAGVVDRKGSVVRSRLERNKSRLGANWKEVVGFADGKKGKAVSTRAAAKGGKGGGVVGQGKKGVKNQAIVVEDEDEEDDEEVETPEGEEDGEEGLRERGLVVDVEGEDEEAGGPGEGEREEEDLESVLGD
ncbi:hypothetical protein K432DRAFT_335961 [Lepidopterella palustris CBS 459.81]|uniref:SCD domain-containing protein n=1 Tax=Lepidopterella palustris CBS 459.81 TaxID=1314670 RepID=A0A8E2E320_9PEZI|nr:hypothetical protein K432DRAFT_335961 [Lepidopterella palustris CBS 459.81]